MSKEAVAAEAQDTARPTDPPGSQSSHDVQSEDGELSPSSEGEIETNNEQPPLPDEPPPPAAQSDDGWEARFDARTEAYYFFNRFTGLSQWENPRVPEADKKRGQPEAHTSDDPPTKPAEPYMGYNPKIHGDYDPNADYAKFHEPVTEVLEDLTTPDPMATAAAEASDPYTQLGSFNRFTGKFQSQDKTVEYHNDENKSKRQMGAFFDVDAAANTHDGRSLKAERVNQRLSKKEVKAYNERRREKKDQKRRAFLTS